MKAKETPKEKVFIESKIDEKYLRGSAKCDVYVYECACVVCVLYL